MIEVKNLSKSYKTYRKEPGLRGAIKALVNRKSLAVDAVRSVSFTVSAGEFVGLLGPNGAGKTTLLKMLTGLVVPTSGGAIAFDQYDVARRPRPYLSRIGMVMGQRNQLNPDLPAIDSFRLSQAIYGVPDDEFNARLDQMIGIFEARELLHKPVRKLSLGERMQMELTNVMLHGPELLFLDEPTIGLDFNAASRIRKFLAMINRQLGVTVILTSHYTKDIEELCRRVILINKGAVVYDGQLSGVDERIHGQRDVQIFCVDGAVASQVREALAGLAEPPVIRPVIRDVTPAPGYQTLDSMAPATNVVSFAAVPKQLGAIIKALGDCGASSGILDLKINEVELETVFGAIYARDV